MAGIVVGKSKFEIMVDLMKSLNVSSFDLKEIEKYLKKIKAEPDENGGYSETVVRSVVDHFRLEKDLEKGDKSMISVLKKQVKDLEKENQRLKDENEILKSVKSTVDRIDENLYKLNDDTKKMAEKIEEDWAKNPTDGSVSEDQSDNQQDDYQFDDYDSDAESSSQQ